MTGEQIVIVGAGVIGLTTAYYLKRSDPSLAVTIVARELPRRVSDIGEEWTKGAWASPWAGAIFAASFEAETLEARAIEAESYRLFWRLANEDPSCGIEIRPIRHYFDDECLPDSSKLWFHTFTHGYRRLRPSELPQSLRGITGGVEYQSMCVNPWVYLPWLRSKLEDKHNIKFLQMEVTSVQHAVNKVASSASRVVAVNATGLGAKHLTDVKDSLVESVRGQTMWIHCDYTGPMAIREGREYTYFIPRAFSQGAIFGGISQPENESSTPEESVKYDILTRVGALVPEAVEAARTMAEPFPEGVEPIQKFENVHILKDIVGFRPGRVGGYRIASEKHDDAYVVHAYGFEGAGYISSGGAAKDVLRLVKQALSYF